MVVLLCKQKFNFHEIIYKQNSAADFFQSSQVEVFRIHKPFDGINAFFLSKTEIDLFLRLSLAWAKSPIARTWCNSLLDTDPSSSSRYKRQTKSKKSIELEQRSLLKLKIDVWGSRELCWEANESSSVVWGSFLTFPLWPRFEKYQTMLKNLIKNEFPKNLIPKISKVAGELRNCNCLSFPNTRLKC